MIYKIKFLIALIVLCFVSQRLEAQDVIVKKDGTTILSKVLEVNEANLKYKKFKNPQGPTYSISLSEIMSVNYENGEKDVFDEFKKQIIWILVSIPVLIAILIVDYELLLKITPALYGIIILLLLGVLFTTPVNGATSWYNIGPVSFQPAEFAKIVIVLALSYTIVKIQSKGKNEINVFYKLGIILLVAMIPVMLIVKQPDYGTAMAFIMALIFMLFVAGIDKKYIIIAFAVVIVAVPLLYLFVLPEHAKTRIDVYLNPELDPRGAGYNIIQSKLAIGAGQLFGMGLLKGNQTQLGFLYPKTTDFIFSVIGEELGFVVGAGIIVLYVILITKAIYVAKTTKDIEGSYIAAGIAGIFFFHMLENIGMTMGLLPITGIPLPFVSYGGSSLLSNIIMIGILLNISSRRQKTLFIG